MRDTSLDDFVGEDDASEDGEPADPDAPGGAGGAEPASEDAEATETATDGVDTDTDGNADADGGDEGTPEPAAPTFDWTPGGSVCVACGERVERRWTDDGRLVCAACKRW